MSTAIRPAAGGTASAPAVLDTAPVAGAGFSDVLEAAEGAAVKTDLNAIFARAAAVYDLPESLLKAVARAESGFNPGATSRCGAMGVMQLMPGTARALGVADAYDPEQNIMGGAKYLRQMLDEFGGNTELALAAYNAGPGAVKKYNGVPPYAETQNYVKTVAQYAQLPSGDFYVPSYTASAARGAASGGLASGGADINAALKEMYMMKIIEMEMRALSGDDED